ncbi:L-iditol 2-dehydrogenase, partial [Candidatus Hakubella thermalkaliphila]
KAVVMPEQGKIEIREFPFPDHLEDGAMIVRPIMSGICGTDKHAFRGESVQYAGTEREIFGSYPVIPGHESVAVVVEITPKAMSDIELYV